MTRMTYEQKIIDRSYIGFFLGFVVRLKNYIFYACIRHLARRKGATIGSNSIIPLSLAKRANRNLIVGNSSSIQTDLIDLRAPVKIGNNVIIGSRVEILTCSHDVDSPSWGFKPYGIEIEDYCWVATRAFILPSCRRIAAGAVCGAGSLVVTNVEKMSVVSGNPATHIKFRKSVHSDVVVEALLGGDFERYFKSWKGR